MTEGRHERIYRKDYKPSDFLVDAIDLGFDLAPAETVVKAKMQFRRNPDLPAGSGPLVLHGDELELRSVRLDGSLLHSAGFDADSQGLRIPGVPDSFEFETEVLIRPDDNTKLMGLYTSSNTFCTQCEAEGFRRITYYLDRPDVMARFTTRIEADRAAHPVLLSNGNRVGQGELPGGRHWVQWEDPFRKPSYLFALVAGDLVCHRGTFTTASGREVALEIWVEADNADKCEHALASLRAAMKWDEETYGLEYDLDVYMIVAVNDFNMGAMENKGLNIFNSKYVLAKPSTATDDDYEGIESVVSHEYFHNWTGNRVTCRDWFQLTLKEGLTVFRDQEFSADMTSRAVQRVKDVTRLRTAQFAEDAGPLAHPIRPESYIEMNNFYTATVYEKGAEVIRMYETLLGREGFRKGMDLYFERHDGQAVTCDDFRAAMADANGRDLTQFERWYLQKGTPTLKCVGTHDASARTFTIELTQVAPANEPSFRPTQMPVVVGLVGPDGQDVPLTLEGEDAATAPTERVLELTERTQSWTFHDVEERPVPSVLRGFSAPVRLEMDRSHDDLAFLFANDSDAFNRWDAGQTLLTDIVLGLAADAAKGEALQMDDSIVAAVRDILTADDLDGSLKAQAVSVPSLGVLSQSMTPVQPDALAQARDFVVQTLARELRAELLAARDAARPAGPYSADKASIAGRRLANAALGLLNAIQDDEVTRLASDQFAAADNMTDSQAALAVMCQHNGPERTASLQVFYDRWKEDALVLDKWFSLQAVSRVTDAAAVRELRSHADFQLENPNRVRALIGAFAMQNFRAFHAADGAGYELLADVVITLDPKNPQIASRLVRSLNPWKRYAAPWGEKMKAELERIAAQDGLSKDVFEIVSSALAT